MVDINNLVVFAENGEKDITGLNQTNGFPAALKPARQWFNFLFHSLTSKINEVITKVNSNTNDKFDKTGGTITGEVTLSSKLNLGTSSLTSKNGHTYLPNGYIYQFGYIALSDMIVISQTGPDERYAVIDLPIPFPTEAINPNAVVKATNTGILSDLFAQVVNPTTTQITVKTCTIQGNNNADGIDGVYWSVIGR
jgi:hypothetical protein